MKSTFLPKLRLMGIIEGISTLVLFLIAMPFKYMADMPQAVSIVGSLHGGLFVLLGLFALIAMKKVPISFKLVFFIMVGAVVPFGPFYVDHRWLKPLAEKGD